MIRVDVKPKLLSWPRERAGLEVDALAHRFPKVVAWEHGTDFYFNNGHYGTREDVVFLINGIPVLVIECKNATKEEAIARHRPDSSLPH